MKDRAYAKINLALDVFNIRPDGYHDIRSVMIPIGFYDELEINKSDTDSHWCSKSYIRFNEHNSIIKMISILKERYGIDDHHEIILKKNVPSKAGLGGGTSDAAAALRIFQKMYSLEMSDEEILEVCLKVGADVPFNYYSVPALVTGIGDGISPIEVLKDYYVLLIKPKRGVSTKEAYELLNMETCDHPDIDRLMDALRNGDDLKGLLGNSLEQPAMLLNSDIGIIKNRLTEAGGENVLMSGSGSTVFCIGEDETKMKKLYEMFANSPYYVRFARTLKR